MAFTEPKYTKEIIDEAGKGLIRRDLPMEEMEKVRNIVDNFRTSHNYPLHIFQIWLRRNSIALDGSAIVVQRIKRLTTIQNKLIRMKERRLLLSQMQDIGGCRSIVKNTQIIKQLVQKYKTSSLRHSLWKENDYITNPKAKSGYRGYHLIYDFFSDKKQTYNGQRIEIQLRSKLQHIWATAVEATDTFTKQFLKASQGDERWKMFFKIMSTVIALRENCTPVPNTPVNLKEISRELTGMKEQIETLRKVQLAGEALKKSQEHMKGAKYFLLTLNIDEKMVTLQGFSNEKTASDELKNKESFNNPKLDTVLISTREAKSLENAYPNYFLDIQEFLKILEKTLELDRGMP